MEKNSAKNLFSDRILLENAIFKDCEESYETFKKLFPKFDKELVQKIIIFASKICSFSYKFLGDLMKLTGEITIKFKNTNYFAQYLFLRKIIDKKNFVNEEIPSDSDIEFSIEEFEKPVKENTIWWFIMNDDVPGLVRFISEGKDEIKLEDESTAINEEIFDVIDFSCYCGSLNILKYLVINDEKLDFYACGRAVQSGNENVIEFLISKGRSFDNLLNVAVQSHQNSICRWLYDNYCDNKLTLPYTILSYNTEMFLFFLEDCNWDINSLQAEITCLDSAIFHNDVDLANFIIQKGGTATDKGITKATQKDIKQLLIKNGINRPLHTQRNQNRKISTSFIIFIISIFIIFLSMYMFK